MADERPTKLREASHLPNLSQDARKNGGDMTDNSRGPVQNFLKRKEEVTQRDHDDFSAYVQEKSARDQQQKAPIEAPRREASRVNRRSMLKLVAGTAAGAEAAAYGYQTVTGGTSRRTASCTAAPRRRRPSATISNGN